MTPHALVWWAVLIALIVVLALTGAQVARAVRELKRLNARVDGFADLPVLKAVARAEDDVRRIEASVAGVAPLVERAKAAVATIRRGPIPPDLIAAIGTARAGFAALRAATRR